MRYLRQKSLREVGQEGQDRLSNARVLVVGLGGLGSPVSMYLAAAGVGTLGLIDADRVDVSNLQRQIVFETADQGRHKAEVAAERLSLLNPEVQINFWNETLSSRNAVELLSLFDLVIDCTDSFEAKFLINDAAYKLGKPWVYAAANQFDGHVAWFSSRHQEPCYRCLIPRPPKARIRSCSETGVLGPWVGTVGSLQAHLAICGIVSGFDSKHPLFLSSGELILLDGKGAISTRSMKVPKNQNCLICSQQSEDVELDVLELGTFCESTSAQLELEPDDLKLFNGSFVDVRTHAEFSHRRIAGSLSFPLEELLKGSSVNLIEREKLVVYCSSGVRSLEAVRFLRDQGINARSLKGGLNRLLGGLPSGVSIEGLGV